MKKTKIAEMGKAIQNLDRMAKPSITIIGYMELLSHLLRKGYWKLATVLEI